MKKWQGFERLVAAIHSVLNASDYNVEHDVTIAEKFGATHQIDVLLRPKTAFAGPILISCKAWTDPVGIDHVREWSDIVQHTGAASGVIVAQSGFTSGAVDAAGNPERRISLWKPRPLTEADFAPDKDSPDGYIARITIHCTVRVPRFVEGTFKLDVSRADGIAAKREVQFNFSSENRAQWYLRDVQDNVVDNLWDMFLLRATSADKSGTFEIIPRDPRFLALDGIRMVLHGVTFAIELIVHECDCEIDLFKDAIGYENVVSRQLKIVPLPMIGEIERLQPHQ